MSVFQKVPREQYLFETNSFYIIADNYPVNAGHLLIISKQLRKTYFELSEEERNELPSLIDHARKIIEKQYNPDGYNIGMNCGAAAGQTVMHFHCHVIPRYKGDMSDPRGGVRHCVEGKGYYQ
jgi:diadenosine tetraphosphate (Ap4A) HIT family hydrolase